jgi:hypothetical protein
MFLDSNTLYDTLGEIMSERRGDSSNMPGYKNAYTTSPQDVEPSDKFAWKVVAVVSFNNAVDWAAYRGPTDWSDDEVAMSGSKLKEGTARGLFPLLSNIPYRL